MGPQRKQQMLDDACKASPEVADAYTTLKATYAEDPNPLTRTSSRTMAARVALKFALQDCGMNRFDARVLSEFPGSETAKGR